MDTDYKDTKIIHRNRKKKQKEKVKTTKTFCKLCFSGATQTRAGKLKFLLIIII